MTLPNKKLNNGFEMPVFGIGTYNMSSREDIGAIRTALNLGVIHIDTAESYEEGHTETLVGEVIKNYNRKELFLVSKVQKDNLNSKGIETAVKGTLKRLGTNYLDLYLMHRCPDKDKFKETVDAMNNLVEEGLVRNIGLSNTNTEHTKMLCELTKHPFVCNQVHYNLQFREPEKDGLLGYCQKNDMLLVAWRPVNKGSLTKSGTDITKSGIPILDSMCKKYNKTAAQISINWLISQPNVVTIAKSSNIEHLKDNLGSMGWNMEPEDIELLRKEFPDQKFISDTVSLE